MAEGTEDDRHEKTQAVNHYRIALSILHSWASGSIDLDTGYEDMIGLRRRMTAIEAPRVFDSYDEGRTVDPLHETPAIASGNPFVSKVSLFAGLTRFSAWGLDEMARIRLFDRVDTKYLLPVTILPELLFRLHPYYRVLDIEGRRSCVYQNLYFDTPQFGFFALHHNGKLNRHKVRLRTYQTTKRTFLEVKLKTNTKRTIKSRRAARHMEAGFTPTQHRFLAERLPRAASPLVPALYVWYTRVSLADSARTERVTLDFNLAYGRIADETPHFLDGLLIAEVKQANRTQTSPFRSQMRQWGFRPASFSKYCVGCCMTYSRRLKTNYFKPQLLHLDRVQQAVLGRGGGR